jgi:hypothetical protein
VRQPSGKRRPIKNSCNHCASLTPLLCLPPPHPPLSFTDLECSCQNVSIVGQSGGKGWPIKEDILRLALTAPQLLVESIKPVPQLKDLLLLLGKAVCVGAGGVGRQQQQQQQQQRMWEEGRGGGG